MRGGCRELDATKSRVAVWPSTLSGAISISRILSIIGLIVVFLLAAFAAWHYSPIWLAWHWESDATAIYLTGAAAALVGVWALFSQRIISRRQCTFEHIAASEADQDLLRVRQSFRELTKRNGGLKELAAPDKEQTPEFQDVVTRLNWFELVSIGIQRGSLDFEFYRRWLKAGTIRTWHDSEEFVKELRKRQHNELLYYEFEQLAGWLSNDSRPPRSRWWGVFF